MILARRDCSKRVRGTRYTAVDLFAGCGGLSLGLEWAGFEVLLANEKHPDACTTYRANHPHVDLLQGEIQDVTNDEFRRKINSVLGDSDKLTLVAGGPP
ncbi:uncharacterized protein METZ01_LOCUS344789, partial [marine metagenome]